MIGQVVLSCLSRNSHFHPNRSINLWKKKPRNIWLESRNIVLLVDIQIWNLSDV